MVRFDIIANKYYKIHKPKWLQIPDHPCKYLSGSVKTYALMNLMHHQPNTDNMYLYVEDEPGYQ